MDMDDILEHANGHMDKTWSRLKMSGRGLVLYAMPESEQNAIMARGERAGDDRWWLGDMNNLWARRVRDGMLAASVTDVNAAIAYLYGDNVSARSIRYYGELSAFYDELSRDEYSMLPWSHFELAMRYHRAGVKNWQETLELSAGYMPAHNGKRPTAQWLEMAVTGKIESMQAESIHDGLPDVDEAQIENAADVLLFDIMGMQMSNDAEPPRFRVETLQALSKAVELFKPRLDAVPVDEELKAELESALLNLISVLTRVVKAVIK